MKQAGQWMFLFNDAVAPLARAGRGLKRFSCETTRRPNPVAPLARAGRGLKQKKAAAVHTLRGCRPARKSGARIETTVFFWLNVVFLVAPLARAGRGLKQVGLNVSSRLV